MSLVGIIKNHIPPTSIIYGGTDGEDVPLYGAASMSSGPAEIDLKPHVNGEPTISREKQVKPKFSYAYGGTDVEGAPLYSRP